MASSDPVRLCRIGRQAFVIESDGIGFVCSQDRWFVGKSPVSSALEAAFRR